MEEYIDYIECGDCLQLMNDLPNECIDVVLTSPPYNIIRPNLNDRGYDLYKDTKTVDEYITFTLNVFNQFDRILKENGCVLYNLSYGSENTEQMWLCIAEILKRTNFTIADCIVWKKSNAIPNSMSKNKLTRICEHVFAFCRKGEFKTFNMNKKIKSYRKTGQPNYENIYNFIEAKNNDGPCNLNKATFSTDFVCKLLDIYSSEDDVILDPFMGTGTTMAGCVIKNRHYVGYELSEKQFDYACDRLDKLEGASNA